MRTHPWLTAGLLAALAVSVVALLAVPPTAAQGGDQKTSKVAAKNPADDPKPAPSPEDELLSPAERGYKGSGAYRWLNIALQATAREHERNAPRPTIGSRNLAIVVTAMYDAWAAYDARAVGTRLGGELRRPLRERTTANKEKAIAYRRHPRPARHVSRGCRLDQGPRPPGGDRPERVDHRCLDARRASATSPRRPCSSTGTTTAPTSSATRPGSNGKAYSDWTYYKPVNPPGPAPMVDPNRWQAIPFDNGKGGTVVIGFLTPHWYRVKPFALERSDQFRPGPPPKVGSEQLKKEVDECIAVNANLTVEQKAIVEFMRDGPKSTGQSGHWLTFAKAVSRRDRNDIDRDVKMFFAVGNVCFDAFISCWDTKRHYDSSRPWSLVRYYYKGKKVKCWAGPGKGVLDMPAEDWHPYSPAIFVTPPFPGYTSGHSTVSGAGGKMLELFTGSDRFDDVEKRKAGILTEPGFSCQAIMMRDGKLPTGHEKMTCDVALALPTFSATSEMAAISRLWGGYHIRTDNEVGLSVGRKLAQYEWPRIQEYFNGTAAGGEGGARTVGAK